MQPRGAAQLRAAPGVEMPTSLLARIDGVVSEMERELTEEDMEPPLNEFHQRAAPGNVGEGGRTIDWLDKQICAIEQRREACELRQTHLAELRQIVAEGKAWGLTPDGDMVEDGGSQGSALQAVAPGLDASDGEPEGASERLPHGRLTVLEKEHLALKHQVLGFERERVGVERRPAEPAAPVPDHEGLRMRAALEEELRAARGSADHEIRHASEAVEVEKRRSQLAEEVANERVVQATLESQALQERLYEAQLALERERQFSEEAAEAQQSAEADLRTLEDKSRDVLQDCRALQATVLELEEERIQMGEAQAAASRRAAELEMELANALPSERHPAVPEGLRIQELESELAIEVGHARRVAELELELAELRAAHDHHQQNAQISAARASELEGLVGEARALQEHREAELKVHVSRIQELEGLFGSGTATQAQHLHRIQELEGQLAEAKSSEGRHRGQSEQHRAESERLEEQLNALRTSEENSTRQNSGHRAHIAQLEQQVADAEASEAAHNRQHALHRAKLQELEQEIEGARGMQDAHGRQQAAHKRTIADLEAQIEELRLAQEAQLKQHGGQRARLLDLEQQLEAVQAAEGNHSRQHTTHRSRIAELEQELQDSQVAQESTSRQLQNQKQRVAQLEQELEQAQAAEAAHHRQHHTHKARILELEQFQQHAETGEESHARRHTEHRERISTLELEIETFRSSEAGYASQVSAHRSKAEELEREFAALRAREAQALEKHASLEEALRKATASEAEHRGLCERHRLRSQELEAAEAALSGKHALSIGELDEKVVGLTRELQEERARSAEQRRDLELVRKVAEETLQKQDVLQKAESLELEKARLQIQELELRLQQRPSVQERVSNSAQMSAPPMSSAPFSTYVEDLSSVPISQAPLSVASSTTTTLSESGRASLRRQSLQVSSVSTRRPLSDELLPGSNDPFVTKVRASLYGTRGVIDKVSLSHFKSIEAQLTSVLEAHMAGRELKEGVLNYHNVVLESERHMCTDEVEARKDDLLALSKELQVQNHLRGEEREEILERLRHDLERCEDELLLLRPTSPLADVPEGTLHTLMGVQQRVSLGQPISNDWSGGFSPMHWAAESGRRDIVAYLLRLDGGASLLNARDKNGRTPLYYANGARRPALAQHLVEAGATLPMHSQDNRPNVSHLPPQYMIVLQQIEAHGWHSMNWKDGYTMLHWAAEKGHPDLCRYLVQMDADLTARDNKDRTAKDLAEDHRHFDALAVLQELATTPREMNLIPGSSAGNLSGSRLERARTSSFGFGTSVAGRDDEQLSERGSVSSMGSTKGIPEAYKKVIDQIEKLGWDKMLWARKFTLLHWAAKNDNADLCAYFLFKKADPSERDDNGRSAFDYANDAASQAALEQLRRGSPFAEPKIKEMTISRKARSSALVEASWRTSVQEEQFMLGDNN